ncbi:hypothetical protein Pla163_37610 [Planctomycetes bacterium Pla163]|uniref:Uncharacterized protein n=1 Tax=Rohdeia mirabilis TaxID=2528008 RepID=A0A518D555_9BACT|nr:hypothetical protein Pla163_37610 [Planctomycetes bacterium Pla163]
MKLASSLPVLARIAAVAGLVGTVLFATAGDFDFGSFGAMEWVLFLFFPVGLALGLAYGLVRPGRGGALAILAIAGFYGVHHAIHGAWPKGPIFLLLASPALLLLVSAKKRGDTDGR